MYPRNGYRGCIVKTRTANAPKVLLVGYNGANNTGAEARLLATIDDVRAVFGSDAPITIPTLNEKNLRRYLKEGPNLRIAPIPPIFFRSLERLVKEHDLIMLVEGSTYMDTWTSVLLWFFLWASRCAVRMGKPCLAYAVDAGDLSSFNRRLVRNVASRTDLIITRNGFSAARLESWGVAAPVEVTTDTAFTFCTNPADETFLRDEWPEQSGRMVGIAPVDFYQWPVVIRPWDRAQYRYRWPYYFSHSPERRRSAENLAHLLAAEADRIIGTYDKSVALICMEELDEPLARNIMLHMKHTGRVKLFSSRCHNTSQMTLLLRSLDGLVTSRFHAGVLSLAAKVPQTAIGHDWRLRTFYHDLGLTEYFIDYTEPNLAELLRDRVDRMFSESIILKQDLSVRFEDFMMKTARNRELLRSFVETHGWEAAG